jgi:hypothetical protein
MIVEIVESNNNDGNKFTMVTTYSKAKWID